MARLVPLRATVKLAAACRRPRPALRRLALVVPVALTALAITGCGGSGGPHARVSLHAASEHRLLALLDRARSQDAAHSRTGVEVALTRFIHDVNSLRGSRELTASTAAAMDRQALATEAQASRQLPPTNPPVIQATASPPSKPPHPKHSGKGGPGGPPGQADGKQHKGGHGPGDGQQGGDGNGGGSGDGDS